MMLLRSFIFIYPQGFQIKYNFLPLHPRRKNSGDNVEYIKIQNGN
jgi:hypothetical protein